MTGRIASPEEWRAFAAEALGQAGLPDEPAKAVATGLVEGDLYGHSTHGLALLADYVEEIRSGAMETEGRPQVLNDSGAALTWDARRLPGVWTTMLAVDAAVERAGKFGLAGVAIRRSHHIACLAAFLEAPARAGNFILIFSSDPSAAHVAPYGGIAPVITPDPVAAGIPAEPDPILIDVSMSITTAGMVGRSRAAGKPMQGKWLLGPDGRPTDDPSALGTGGSILPIGGLEYGHKGFGLGLLVEALTQGLSGYGRADGPKDWGASVLVMAFAPARFAGSDGFLRQTNWLADACRAAVPRDPAAPVRLPGQLALARKRAATRDGLRLDSIIVNSLAKLARDSNLALPGEELATDTSGDGS